MNWSKIEQSISEATHTHFTVLHYQAIGGGCINTAFRISDQTQQYFIKTNIKQRLDMFIAEFLALEEIHNTHTVKVPIPICYGHNEQQSFLVTEYLSLSNAKNDPLLGRQLAAMHRHTQSEFGWKRHNTIGSTPQINTPSNDWVEFYREHRLHFQLKLAERNGYSNKLLSLGEQLLACVNHLFEQYTPQASILHGDLWAGNAGTTTGRQPVIYDPALYYGDRESDIAMTELFGGFGPDFYSAYNEAWPLEPGYKIRKELYALYHILNHLNLFGGGYENQAIAITRSLLAHLSHS